MNSAIQSLSACADIPALRHQLHSLCSRFGAVAKLDILSANQAGHQQAMCFLRMASPEQELELMHEFGIGRFGGDLVMVVDLHPDASPALAADGARPSTLAS
ncbi:MAG: hypothetical protein V4731_05550 [Pseudomonadota bacterium]